MRHARVDAAAGTLFLVGVAASFAGVAGAWSLFPATASRIERIYARLRRTDHRLLYAGILAAAGLVRLTVALLPVR
ncbi:hypothetical protein [Microbacterium sp. RURRCA19A]|uniref:hypothetical protein n=1 Tax=Microbacterium sp. RURRCA19A TaxID=1907391 RepID=UPI000956B56D|nr:hypothetical protein [Microbacterium sp. RURRCA19A]SIS11309.1 hypothetical protein SAMN05880568_2865 [Microbacterium sp. RURRCA19A]